MKANKIIRFSSAHHLSREELVQYNLGQLPAKERHDVEMHLLDCELCSEALQGIAGMDDTMRLARITHELHARTFRKLSTRRKIFSQAQLISLIAVILLLAFLVLFSLYLIR